MKKCGILVLAALATILNGRLNAAVESDVVGYTTITVDTGKLNLMALPFDSLQGESGMSIQDVFSGSIPVNSTIQLWNGSGFETLTYRTMAAGTGWFKNRSTLSDIKLVPGSSFWMQTPSNSSSETTTLTVTGKVVTASSDLAIEAGHLTLVGPDYPQDVSVQDIQFENISAGDTIQFWNGSKFETLTYRSVGWYKNRTELSDKVFSSHEGFWILTKNSVTINFPRN